MLRCGWEVPSSRPGRSGTLKLHSLLSQVDTTHYGSRVRGGEGRGGIGDGSIPILPQIPLHSGGKGGKEG